MAAPQGWSKLYNDLPNHPKFLRAGYQAGWMYICGQCYCAQNLTDGRIPKAMVLRLTSLPKPMLAVRKLVESGLWHDRGDCYEQHDYCEMQRTAAEVDRVRAANRERQERLRLSRRDRVSSNAVTNAVTNADVTRTESETEKSTVPPPTPPRKEEEVEGGNGHKGWDVVRKWKELGLPLPKVYDAAQAAMRVNTLSQWFDSPELLRAVQRVKEIPALDWVAKRGPAYLAQNTSSGQRVVEAVLNWEDRPDREGPPDPPLMDTRPVERTRTLLHEYRNVDSAPVPIKALLAAISGQPSQPSQDGGHGGTLGA